MRIHLAEESGEIESLGSFLKNKRSSIGLSIKKVAKELRIKEKYIKAIEKNQLDQLPTLAHQKIFVKTYSEFLGIDFEELKRDFEFEKQKPILTQDKPEQSSTFFPVLAGFILGLVCTLVFFKHMPEQGQNLLENEILPQGVMAEASSVSATVKSTLVVKITLRLEGEEDSWVQVVADKDTLFNGVLRQGTAWECKAQNQFMINISRSWAVVGFIDGQPLLPFGSHGEFAKKAIITKENYPSFVDSSKIR